MIIMTVHTPKDDHFEPEDSFPEEHVSWHERPVDDDDTVDDMETPHGSDSEKLTQGIIKQQQSRFTVFEMHIL